MEDIKVIFEKMLKEHEASIVQKNQEMFLALTSGNNSLTNQRLDNLIKNMGDKIRKREEKINLMTEELHVIQTTKPSWAIETYAKLID